MLVVCIFASALGALVMCLLVLRHGFSPVSPADPARADHDLLVTRLGHAAAGVCFATIAILATVLVARTPVQSVVTPPDPRLTERLATLDRERQALGEQVGTLGATVQALRDQIGAVGGNVQGVRARLDQTEGRVAGIEAGLKRLGDDVAQVSLRARQAGRPVAARPVAAPAREPAAQPATRSSLRAVPVVAERAPESASPAIPEAVSPGPVTQAAPHGAVASAPPKPALVPAPAAHAVAAPPLPSPSLGDKLRGDWDKIRRGFASGGDDIASAVRNLGRRTAGRDN